MCKEAQKEGRNPETGFSVLSIAQLIAEQLFNFSEECVSAIQNSIGIC